MGTPLPGSPWRTARAVIASIGNRRARGSRPLGYSRRYDHGHAYGADGFLPACDGTPESGPEGGSGVGLSFFCHGIYHMILREPSHSSIFFLML
jgi:hypothetical protein